MSSIYFNTKAQTDSMNKLETLKVAITTGEKIFIENADQCLAIMEQRAKKMSVEGVDWFYKQY